jgi:hypothetical protein
MGLASTISASCCVPSLTSCRSPKTVKYDQVFLKTWSRGNTYTKFKAKYSKKETLRNITPLGEETSILMVDSKDKEEEEVWVEVEDRSSVTTMHN